MNSSKEPSQSSQPLGAPIKPSAPEKPEQLIYVKPGISKNSKGQLQTVPIDEQVKHFRGK